MAITSSVHPDPITPIEPLTYGSGADSQSLLFALMTEAGSRGNQPLQLPANMARHPIMALRAARVRSLSRRTMVVLVLQSLDNAMRAQGQVQVAEWKRAADDRAGSELTPTPTRFPPPTGD